VIPSESLDIHPASSETREAVQAQYQRNVLSGVIERVETVGHLVQVAITVVGGRTVVLEGHVDKYRRDDFNYPLKDR